MDLNFNFEYYVNWEIYFFTLRTVHFQYAYGAICYKNIFFKEKILVERSNNTRNI